MIIDMISLCTIFLLNNIYIINNNITITIQIIYLWEVVFDDSHLFPVISNVRNRTRR